ncbi:MAG: hypothetical protein H7323_13255, partial [Frankiales bacterium]|nr:hypothetical protein [Frankiales bacterium]
EVVQTAPSGPSATFTVSVAETSTFRVDALGPDGCGPASATFTRTVTSASPTPTPTPHADRACPTVTVAQPPTITSGQTVDIVVSVRSPSASNTVTLLRKDPAPVVAVRTETTTATTTTFTVRLGETHRFVASASDGNSCLGGNSASFFAPVRALVSIAAVRNSTRTYTFTGRVQPAAGTVALYRVEASGRRVLTSTAPVQTDGTYRIDRTFLGSGRFGFVTVAKPGSTGRYSTSESAVRPTIIH